MNLLEIVSKNGFVLDLFGVIGLGLVGLAAVRMAQRSGSRSALVMSWGAVGLILGRLGMLLLSVWVTPLNAHQFDPMLLMVGRDLPILLLTGGLGAVVWGFWSHEREVSGEQAS